MTTPLRNCRAAILLLLPLCAAAAPVERQFDLRLTMSGTQSWKNELQSTEATTAQDYDLSTRLRSDGFLYSDNLLDPDLSARLEIKQQYYARQGLKRLKAENGGKLPTTTEDIDKLADRYRAQGSQCRDDYECNALAVERFAAIGALKSNTPQALEEFLAAPGGGEEPRYLYFFGYAGCPVRLHISYAVEVKGQRAYDRDKKKLVPYSLSRHADTPGDAVDQKTLCEKYIATVDVKTDTVYLENAFIPSPPGTSVRRINDNVETQEIPLPPVAEMMNWVNAKLRMTKPAGSEKVQLKMTTPLDGDATVQGLFTGTLDLAMTWSFKPLGPEPTLAPALAAPQAPAAPSAKPGAQPGTKPPVRKPEPKPAPKPAP